MKISVLAALLMFSFLNFASAKTVSVHAYRKKNGTYVAAHKKTKPNSSKADNYSTKGNVNPYTGKKGTKK